MSMINHNQGPSMMSDSAIIQPVWSFPSALIDLVIELERRANAGHLFGIPVNSTDEIKIRLVFTRIGLESPASKVRNVHVAGRIHSRPVATIKEVAAEANVTEANTRKLIQSLERDGFLDSGILEDLGASKAKAYWSTSSSHQDLQTWHEMLYHMERAGLLSKDVVRNQFFNVAAYGQRDFHRNADLQNALENVKADLSKK